MKTFTAIIEQDKYLGIITIQNVKPWTTGVAVGGAEFYGDYN